MLTRQTRRFESLSHPVTQTMAAAAAATVAAAAATAAATAAAVATVAATAAAAAATDSTVSLAPRASEQRSGREPCRQTDGSCSAASATEIMNEPVRRLALAHRGLLRLLAGADAASWCGAGQGRRSSLGREGAQGARWPRPPHDQGRRVPPSAREAREAREARDVCLCRVSCA